MRPKRFLPIAIVVFAAWNAQAANVSATDRVTREFSLDLGGSFWIDNPVGPIDIAGVDGDHITLTAVRTVIGEDRNALKEGREQTLISFEGDDKVRFVHTIIPPHAGHWTSAVAYTIRVPRTADVKIGAKVGDIRIVNISGHVTVKSFSSSVTLSAVTGNLAVDIVNGHIMCDFPRQPLVNAQFQAVNGDIDIRVPAEATFEWVGDTLAGDLITTLAVRGKNAGTVFHGHINGSGGPTVITQSLLGQVRLLARGPQPGETRSVRNAQISPDEPPNPMLQPAQKIQMPFYAGDFVFSRSVSDISIGEVRGFAKIAIGAGEIGLGVVYGECNVATLGGPLNLGDIIGPLLARTGAGDILVRAAREGGSIWTGGGIIRLLYTGGPTTVQSGGGDIVVRQATGPINAETPSGDISLTIDPNVRTQRVGAKTGKGNVVLNLSPRFAADVDATVITSDADANAIQSDFAGLSIQKEQIGGRTRIRATGKINGGGDRIDLYAEEGDIHITAQSTSRVTLMKPVK